jgi:tetratricopeptide (TPR) repeat protein
LELWNLGTLDVPPESTRIADLRRRVEADPSSIAFAQLAEEYRRAGNYEAAEQCCHTGLTRHPAYLSARVTLGRTLIELDKLDEAEEELQFVLKSAPDNLAAIRGMAEIHQRRGHLETALAYFRRALPLARHDPEIEETVKQINRDLGAATPPEQSSGLSFSEARDEFLSALSRLPEASLEAPPVAPVAPAAPEHRTAPEQRTAPEHRTAPDAPSALDAPDAPDPVTDFDGLLQSLGTPNHPAPSMMEALLTEPVAPPARPEPVLPELPVETPASDPFADLERGLRAFDHPVAEPEPTLTDGEVSKEAASPAPSEPPAPSAPSDTEQSILEELEAWLGTFKR